MELPISTETASDETLGPNIELGQSTESEEILGPRVLLFLAPLRAGLIPPSTSTYSEESKEYPSTT
jgi:hypothetical protein